MLIPAGILLLATLGGCAAALVFGGEAVVTPVLIGLFVTLPLALATLVGSIWICQLKPEFGPAVILGATFLRMVWSVGAVAWLQNQAEELGTTPTALARWTAAFYIGTLVVEALLLWAILTKASRVKSPPSDAPSQKE